jgi:hypothetical protein
MSSQGISFDPATVIVSWDDGNYTATLVYGGFGYSQGDTFVYQGTLFGGSTPANDLTLTFTISATGVLSGPGQSGTAPDGKTDSITLTLDNVRDSKMNRDASDYTKMLKQRSIYLEKRENSPITNRQSADAWIPQGNQYRIDYLMGKVKCRACVGGAFNLNGPRSNS